LRRWARVAGSGPEGDLLELRYSDVDYIANRVVGYGGDVRVIEPPEVREVVIQRLKEIATRHEAVAAGAPA
jgi:proteasome accessory factor B